MKNPFDSLTKKFAKTASVEVKKEVKKTVIDLLPGILTIAGTIIGLVIFHNVHDSYDDEPCCFPAHSSTTITTNNYFFQDLSEDMIKKIIDDE